MKAWPLDKLLEANRNTVTVYASLRWLAGDLRKLSTTRATIRGLCRLSEDTISEAMTALGRAGWVVVNYGRKTGKTWYRLSFPVPDFFPVPAKRRHSKRVATGKKAAQQTVSCTGKKAAPSLKGGRTVPASEGAGPSRPEERTPTMRYPKPPDSAEEHCSFNDDRDFTPIEAEPDPAELPAPRDEEGCPVAERPPLTEDGAEAAVAGNGGNGQHFARRRS